VPCASVRIDSGISGFGKGSMHAVSVIAWRRPISGGADKGVSEFHPILHPEQPGIDGR
jgi:hypothetical protein